MKKQINNLGAILTLVGSTMLVSCSSESKENTEKPAEKVAAINSKDMILAELDNFFANFKGGLSLGVDMAKVKEVDKDVKDFLVDGKPCGNYNFNGSNDQIEWERFYSKGAPESTTLYELRFWATDKTLESDAGTKNIDLNAIAKKVNALTGVTFTKGKPGELDENLFYWQAADYFCWMEPGTENTFTIYIRKEKQ